MKKTAMPFIAIILALLSACKGADGAAGPQGPAGAQGQQGAAGAQGLAGPQGAAGTTKLTITGQISPDGTAIRDLPAGVGTMSAPPTFACYLFWNAGGVSSWVQVGDPFDDVASCKLSGTPGAATLRISLKGGVGGQSFAFVVVY